MIKIEGGTTMMGSEGVFETVYGTKRFPEEKPQVEIEVTGFWMDETEVTNAQFAKFVEETGYVTFAEQEADTSLFPPEALAQLPKPPFNNGAIIFNTPEKLDGKVMDPGSFMQWWKWDPEANWRKPEGKDSTIEGRDNYPVSCVTYDDAAALRKMGGKTPTD